MVYNDACSTTPDAYNPAKFPLDSRTLLIKFARTVNAEFQNPPADPLISPRDAVQKSGTTSHQNISRDGAGTYAKFSAPTIANGHVYLPTFSNQVVVYGLR